VVVVFALITLMASAGIEFLQANAQKNRALAALKDATALSTISQAHDRLSDTDTGDDVRAYQFLLAGQLLADSPAAQGSVYNAELNAVYAHPNLLSVAEPAPHVADGLTALTADGTRAASDDGGDVKVWSTRTGQAIGPTLQPPAAPRGGALAIAFGPDGRRLAVAYPKRVVVWDTGSGKKIAEIAKPDNSSTAGIGLSPDGNTVGVDGGDMRLWDVRTGKPIGAPVPVEGGHVAFSPDGRRVAFDEIFSTSTNVYVRDLAPGGTGEVRFTVPNGMGNCMAFSPDGHDLAIGTVNSMLQLWNADTGKPASSRMTGHAGAINDVAFSPDGTRLATAGQDRTIREWSTATGTAVGYPLTGPNQAVNYVRFTPDGKHLISLSADRTVRRWDAMTGTEPIVPGGRLTPGQIAIDPQGTNVAAVGGDGVQVWNYATGRRVATLPVSGGVASVSYSPDGKSLLIVTVLNGRLLLWDGATLRPVKFEPAVGPLTAAAFVPAGLPFMPTGKEIAVGTSSGKLVLEDIDANLSGKPGATINTGCPVQHIAISKDGMHVAYSCLHSDKLGVADGHTKSIHVDTATSTVEAMAFSPDGNTLIIGTADGLVWRRDGSDNTTTSVGVHRGEVTAIAYSPDGRFFASAGAGGSVVVYPATSKLISARLTAYSGSVAALAFTADSGHLIAFSSTERAAQIWHVVPDPTTELCDRVPYNMSSSDWNKWVSSVLAYQIPCADKPQQPAG
jgi:WD40 repeat protein